MMRLFLKSGAYALAWGAVVALAWTFLDLLTGSSVHDFVGTTCAAMAGAWLPIMMLLERLESAPCPRVSSPT